MNKETVLKTMEKKFGKKTIDQVEASIDRSKSAHKEMIFTLLYLNKTKRFKENKTYRKASWGVYLDGRFNITEATYETARISYIKYGEIADKYGVGVPIYARNKVGAKKMDEVLDQIVKKDKQKVNPITRHEINRIIESNMPEKKEMTAQTKSSLRTERDWVDDQRIEIEKEVINVTNEKDKQISKLKATVEQKNKQITKLEARVIRLEKELSATRGLREAIIPFLSDEISLNEIRV